jgi:serine/threonine-protein kinase
MPYVDGESLQARIAREGALPIAEAVSILRDLAKALAHAHAHGVMHRDLKPDNVLLVGDTAMLTDFGIAKALDAATTGSVERTAGGMAVGTPMYLSPEQAAGDPHVDHRTDLYALGIVAYEMLTGEPPFTHRVLRTLLAAHQNQLPAPVATRRPHVPPLLARLVMRLLEKQPADRPQSADGVVRVIDRVSSSPLEAESPVTLTAARPKVEMPGGSIIERRERERRRSAQRTPLVRADPSRGGVES